MASWEDGRLATPLTYIHYSTNNMPLTFTTFYVKVMGYPATIEQIFYYVIEAGLGVVA